MIQSGFEKRESWRSDDLQKDSLRSTKLKVDPKSDESLKMGKGLKSLCPNVP